MKKLVTTILTLLVITSAGFAQPGERALERIHAAKIAYITDRLQLTSEQSANFIPVYNEYEKEVRSTRMSFFRKYKNMDPGDADDATSRQYIDDDLDYQQQIIDLKRKYNDRFLKVLTPQQLADLSRAEREFKQMLMRRLHEHGGLGRGPGGGRFR